MTPAAPSLDGLLARWRGSEEPALLSDEVSWRWCDVADLVERRIEDARQEPVRPLVAHGTPEVVLDILTAVVARQVLVLQHPRWRERERSRALQDVESFSATLARHVDSSAAHPLAVVFSSGTSGRPKGVVLSRRAFEASALASESVLPWTEGDRWLLAMPLAHVGGLSIVIRCALALKTIVLAPTSGADPPKLHQLMTQHRASIVSLVPTMLFRLLEDDATSTPAESLRAVLLGGAAASPSLVRRARRQGWPVVLTYGLTEACSQVATQRLAAVESAEDVSLAAPPIPGTEVRVEAPDPEGVGTLEIRGPTLFSGYCQAGSAQLDQPGRDGWFSTGDFGRLDAQGRVEVVGRRSDLIVSGGENVYPQEVETFLETHELIERSCVFSLPDDEWGHVVAAVVVTAADRAQPSRDQLRSFIRAGLAGFKRPRAVAFVNDLVLGGSGKVDRNANREQFEGSLERL